MSDCNMKVSVGLWIIMEYCILDIVELFLYFICFFFSEDNIIYLYNYVVCLCFVREFKLIVNEKILK